MVSADFSPILFHIRVPGMGDMTLQRKKTDIADNREFVKIKNQTKRTKQPNQKGTVSKDTPPTAPQQQIDTH